MGKVVEKERVGEKLPKGWQWRELGECAQLINGRAYLQHELLSEGTPVIRIQNLNGGDHWYYSNLDLPPEKYCDKGDLLFAWSTTFGPYVWNGKKSIFHYHIWKVLTFNLLDKNFAFYLLQRITADIKATSHGASMLHVTKGAIEKWKIPLPPLPEQKRIVGILSDRLATIEQARAATAAQLAAAKALPAAYLRQVFDSPEAQKWKRKKLGDVTSTCSGSTPSRSRKDYYIGAIPWVKTGELKDSIVHETEEHISEMALRETSVKLLPVNTLLVAMYGQGQTRGRTGLLTKPATTNQACFAILPNDSEFDSKYLQLWFRHNYVRLREETEGRGGNQPNLNGELLREQIIDLPPLKRQREIIAKLMQLEQQVKTLQQSLQSQLDTINQLPAALIRQAFNGEL